MPKRRRGSRRAHRPTEIGRRHDRFERLVERALAGIPSPFRESLREVAIVIEDEPSDDQLREDALGGDGLYGLYEGTPRTEWAADSVAATVNSREPVANTRARMMMVTIAMPISPDAGPSASESNARAMRSSPAAAPNNVRYWAASANSDTTTAVSRRAEKRRTERRADSTGPTSPRTMPDRT